MKIEERVKLISRFTEEVMTTDDLAMLLSKDVPLRHYIGFEISGKIHLGTGLMCMQKVKDFHDAGIQCNIFLADWHTWINDKLGGDRARIKEVAIGYFKEGLKASYQCLGGNPDDLTFTLGSDLYHNNDKYWETVIDVSKHVTLGRMKRSITILGRKEGEETDFAKLIYPAMQVADIFIQQIHLPHAGLDQRKAQVIARDIANKVSITPLFVGDNQIKPIATHHHLILGLQKPNVWPIPKDMDRQDIWSSMKMSKSKPDGAVFVHDSVEEIKRKVAKAFCPEKETEFNPIIDWVEFLVFSREDDITIKREKKYGGDLRVESIENLKDKFKKGDIHSEDLKNFVSEYLINLLEPVRKHFDKEQPKKMLDELNRLMSSQ